MGPGEKSSFQDRARAWVVACFGAEKADDTAHRALRFAEEAAELCQAAGMSLNDLIAAATSVYDREPGLPEQEVGGVVLTLSPLCSAMGIDMEAAAEAELARVIPKIEKIREKEWVKSAADSAMRVNGEAERGKAGYAWVVARASLKSAEELGLSDAEYAHCLGINPEAVEDLRSAHIGLPEDQPAFRHAVDMIRINLRLRDILGYGDASKSAWMRIPNTVLRGVPADLMSRPGGAGRVLAHLSAMNKN